MERELVVMKNFYFSVKEQHNLCVIRRRKLGSPELRLGVDANFIAFFLDDIDLPLFVLSDSAEIQLSIFTHYQ
jgi:hypothetical protein